MENGANQEIVNPSTSPAETTTPEPENTQGRVPFHQDPAIQEYLERQKEQVRLEERDRVRREEQERYERLLAIQPRQQEVSDTDTIVNEIAAKYKGNVDPNILKDLTDSLGRLADKRAEAKTKPLMEKLETMEMAGRFGGVFAKNPEAVGLQNEMTRVFGRLSQPERDFVLKSPDGAEWLYAKTKNLVTGGQTPEQTRISASTTRSNSVPSSTKMDETSPSVGLAIKAAISGDKQGYEKHVQGLIKK